MDSSLTDVPDEFCAVSSGVSCSSGASVLEDDEVLSHLAWPEAAAAAAAGPGIVELELVPWPGTAGCLRL